MIFYFTWEDVGIISLSRSEDTAIAQRHLPKRTSTGKETSALWTKKQSNKQMTGDEGKGSQQEDK